MSSLFINSGSKDTSPGGARSGLQAPDLGNLGSSLGPQQPGGLCGSCMILSHCGFAQHYIYKNGQCMRGASTCPFSTSLGGI